MSPRAKQNATPHTNPTRHTRRQHTMHKTQTNTPGKTNKADIRGHARINTTCQPDKPDTYHTCVQACTYEAARACSCACLGGCAHRDINHHACKWPWQPCYKISERTETQANSMEHRPHSTVRSCSAMPPLPLNNGHNTHPTATCRAHAKHPHASRTAQYAWQTKKTQRRYNNLGPRRQRQHTNHTAYHNTDTALQYKRRW